VRLASRISASICSLVMVKLLCTEPLSLPHAGFRDPLKWIVKIP